MNIDEKIAKLLHYASVMQAYQNGMDIRFRAKTSQEVRTYNKNKDKNVILFERTDLMDFFEIEIIDESHNILEVAVQLAAELEAEYCSCASTKEPNPELDLFWRNEVIPAIGNAFAAKYGRELCQLTEKDAINERIAKQGGAS